MLESLAIVGSLFFSALIAGVPAAIILRAAVWGDNKITGSGDSPTAVPRPSIGKAIRISLFTLFYIFIVAHAMKYLPIAGGNGTFIAIFIYFLINVLIMAGMLRYYLPTTFKSATRVALSWTLMISALLWLLNITGGLELGFRYIPWFFFLVLILILAFAFPRRATIREATKTTGVGDSPTPVPKPSIGKSIRRIFVAILCIVIAPFAIFFLMASYLFLAIPLLFLFALIAGAPAAIFLRAAIWGDNKMTGGRDSPTPVPEPSIGKTIRINFFAMLWIPIVSFLGLCVVVCILWLLGIKTEGGGVFDVFTLILVFLLSSVLVMTRMLRFHLPITFMPAFRVALSWSLMNCALLCLLYAIFHQFIR